MIDRRAQAPDRFRRFSTLNFVLIVALAAILLASMGQVAPSPKQLADGLPGMANLVGRMLPPNTEPDFLARIAVRMIETFQIALVGAAIGIVLSLPIAWCAARGVSPLGRGNVLVKAAISFLRTVPDLVWALIFVASIGLGAVAGTMTIMVDTIGFCGRFFAEAMEDAEKEPQEALAAIGANRPSILIGAILPDIMPSLINSSLFALEKAVRSSVVLGLVGAGGIGQELKVAFDLFQYRNASMIILAIFVIVLLMEVCTDKLRARLQ
ncbi:Phosphonate uptake transporter [Roseovarius sp. EC-HK134]|jgi:phosphonate transport system permease protein|uniref:phosphonate ABC transporter, permease protein PhnE n=1 Tax=unclassified Roseovarius TaxID=2614913 RepID=UPI0001556AD4|nr:MULTISPECIES: phosphonate ABC transporter, permease protein PhnE [unclassified Roseovarius]AWZ19467.1 Phosphonate ABC transporter permease protein phnE1 [Roseovarius sp. AK1035]EDM33641.1 Phosphonate uptake transporter [Roseovarius sp. TM1035]VVT14128.1 Phosphonate uptake transporter [Roseovarius sp. EC-HK134]VVT14794.1 Phosphonate uptake transporter [Roseovarius sp. EC-SD190]